MRTHVYIDGFNLYYGLLRDSAYRWLDLQQFCDLLLPRNRVTRISYFTARISDRPRNPGQRQRQAIYLRALATLPRVEVVHGSFLTAVSRQPLVAVDPVSGRWLRQGRLPRLRTDANGQVLTDWVQKTEEKGSDVNFAAYLLRDAFQKACDCAVIVSNDSDLLTPVRMAKVDCGVVIGLAPPREHGSNELKALADFIVQPRRHILAASQFADTVSDEQGPIHKPEPW